MSCNFKSSDYFKDSVGNCILTGDLLRVFHFQTNRKKYYMYKIAGEYKEDGSVKYLDVKHYPVETGSYRITERKASQKLLNGIVVVDRQKFHGIYQLDELKRNRYIRD